jgi:dUTPase
MQVPFETPEQRLLQVEHELGLLKRSLGGIASFGALTSTEIFVFDDGSMPVRQTEGAIGYDAFARAVVDPLAKPTENNPLRRTVADFKLGDDWEERIDTEVKEWVVPDADDPNKYAISLPPQKRLMVGLGFATKMHFPMFYWVAPRSGYAARGITVANSPGTVDPDYRGEAGALI